MKLSVIIPAWNQTEESAALMASNVSAIWEVAGMDTEIILVNNASKYWNRCENVKPVEWKTNRGIAPAWNHGIKKAKGDLLAFVTTTTTPLRGWDVALAAAAESGNIAFPWTDNDGQGFAKHQAGTGIAGWCFMMTRETQKEVGEFDETFVPAWYEDTDYFHRALQVDVPLVSVPAAHVIHKPHGSSQHMFNRNLLFLSQRLRYSWKHGLDPNQAPPFWQTPLPEWN